MLRTMKSAGDGLSLLPTRKRRKSPWEEQELEEWQRPPERQGPRLGGTGTLGQIGMGGTSGMIRQSNLAAMQTVSQAGTQMAQANVPPEPMYFQPPPYIGPEDIGGVPGYGEGMEAQAPGISPQFYSLTGGDYEELESMIYGQSMGRVREDLASRGLLSSSFHEEAGISAAVGAKQATLTLQAGEQARRTAWEQDEALRQWQQQEQGTRLRMAGYQAAQTEAGQRRQWLWNTYVMQHGDYYQQMAQLIKNVTIPYQAVPYRGTQYMV